MRRIRQRGCIQRLMWRICAVAFLAVFCVLQLWSRGPIASSELRPNHAIGVSTIQSAAVTQHQTLPRILNVPQLTVTQGGDTSPSAAATGKRKLSISTETAAKVVYMAPREQSPKITTTNAGSQTAKALAALKAATSPGRRQRPLEKCWEVKEEQHSQAAWDGVCHRADASVCRVQHPDRFPKLTSPQTAKLESLGLQVVTYSSEDELSRQLLTDSDWGSETVDAAMEMLGVQDESDRSRWLLDVGAGLGLFTLATVARGRSVAAVEANHHSLARLAASLTTTAADAASADNNRAAAARLYWNALLDATTAGPTQQQATAQLAYRVSGNACGGLAKPRLLLSLGNGSSVGGGVGDAHPGGRQPQENDLLETAVDEEVDAVRVRVASLADVLALERWPAPRLVVKWDMSSAGLGSLLAARRVLAWPNVTSVLLLDVPAEAASGAAGLLSELHYSPHRLQGLQPLLQPDGPSKLDSAVVDSWPKDVAWMRTT